MTIEVPAPLTDPGHIYVASSWRNPYYVGVVAAMKSAGLDFYDFRNPPGGTGFAWREVGMPSYDPGSNGPVPQEEYLEGIQHPIAQAGFASDMKHLMEADTVVLVLDCGKSAHLELGFACGVAHAIRSHVESIAYLLGPDEVPKAPNTCILMPPGDDIVPELMYGMVDYLCPSLFDLLGWLGVED